MYSKVAAVFIKVYDTTVGEFTETELFKSASSNNEEEITNVIEDRTPTLFEEHGKLINWIYGIYKWDGINKLNENELFASNDDEQNALKIAEKSMETFQGDRGQFMISLAYIFNKNEIKEVKSLLNKPLSVRDLYLHVRHMEGNSLIDAIKAQNELNERKEQMEIEKKQAIELATNEAKRIANEAIAKAEEDRDRKIAAANEEIRKTKEASKEGLEMADKCEAQDAEIDKLRADLTERNIIIERFKNMMGKLKKLSESELQSIIHADGIANLSNTLEELIKRV